MKKRLTLLIEEQARLDIYNAYEWYEDKLTGLGEEFKEILDASFEMLLISPNGYEKFGRHHRQFPMDKFPYVILYEATKSNLYIDAVFHTSRNPEDKPK